VVSASSESQPRFKFFDLDGGEENEDVGKAVDLSPDALPFCMSRYSWDTWKVCGQDDGRKRRE